MLGALASIYIKQDAAAPLLLFIIAGIIGCAIWLHYLWYTQWECRVCSRTPKGGCKCNRSPMPDLGPCSECGWSYGKHRPDCSFFPDDFNMMG